MDRDQPDLKKLRRIRDAEKFMWSILPHAARTFSASIAMLPASQATASAVGYLYCRILDTYEDMHPDLERRIKILNSFSDRFKVDQHGNFSVIHSAPRFPIPNVCDARDLTHHLLVERCDLIDNVFRTLPVRDQKLIIKLVDSMATGMASSARMFADQGGSLQNDQQLFTYCDQVLGNPVRFSIALIQGHELSSEQLPLAEDLGVLVQLANVTRDIEKDLLESISYHPNLKPLIGHKILPLRAEGGDSEFQNGARKNVRETRTKILQLAFQRWNSYRKLIATISFKRYSLARASAVLMFQFTDRYYRSCSRRSGGAEWNGPKSIWLILLNCLPCLLSNRWTQWMLLRIERRLPQ